MIENQSNTGLISKSGGHIFIKTFFDITEEFPKSCLTYFAHKCQIY
jgi:hypothetical protein